MITVINNEVDYAKKEVVNLRTEKDSLENVLALKA
jgi:hypothetical protein